MKGESHYHFKLDLVTNEAGPVQRGQSREYGLFPDYVTQGRIMERDRAMFFDFWVPGTAAALKGQEMYVFGTYVGWRNGLNDILHSSFPSARDIQKKIRDKIEADLGDQMVEDGHGLIYEFFDHMFAPGRPSIQILNSNDPEGDRVTEEAGLHEDYSWSYTFTLVGRVILP